MFTLSRFTVSIEWTISACASGRVSCAVRAASEDPTAPSLQDKFNSMLKVLRVLVFARCAFHTPCSWSASSRLCLAWRAPSPARRPIGDNNVCMSSSKRLCSRRAASLAHSIAEL